MPIVNINDNCSPCSGNPITVIQNPCTCGSPTCSQCNDKCGCPVKLDFSCIIYNKNGGVLSDLINLSLPNGSNLKQVIERIDYLLGQNNIFNFASYDISCLRSLYVINGFGDFATAVSKEICGLKSDLDTINCSLTEQINNFNTTINNLNYPNFSDTCGLGILVTDSIKDILIKLKDGYCSLKNTILSENSPSFLPINSNTVSWLSGGYKGHQPTANVKLSGNAGNILQALSDGLYVAQSTSSSAPQVLSYSAGTRTISLSGGGGNVVLPNDNDNQNLTWNGTTKILGISDGNTVDLSGLEETANSKTDTSSVAITLSSTKNRNISANVKVSADADNLISIHSDGIYASYSALAAPTPDDIKVKASSSDINPSGYLDEKLEGSVLNSVTTIIAFNALTNKVKASVSIDIPQLITELKTDSTFSNAIKSAFCFKFRIKNTGGVSALYDYVDCAGTSHTGLSLGAGVSVDVCGNSADTSDANIIISNLGFC